ncbi:protein NYNRIN-like [Scomber scombrus]|uniref:Protein NYNRIN-like n=1 Tax=Scomber scombrus TaxID=13677 RepID=A0AAV1NFB6_SCOSC
MKKLLKTNPHLKNVPFKTAELMTPREWMQTKLGFYYVEPFLTDIAEWTDNRYPRDGSFSKSKLDIIKGYLLDNTAVPSPNWDLGYMNDVFKAWNLMSEQWPENIQKPKKRKPKTLTFMTQDSEKPDPTHSAVNHTVSIYPNLHNFVHPPAYESDDDYDLMVACSGISHTKTKSSKDIAKVIPTIIFPDVDNISTQTKIWRKQCIDEWLQNCQKAFESMKRKYKSDQLCDEQMKYATECMAKEFRRMLTVIKTGHDIEVNEISKGLIDSFKSTVKRYQRETDVRLNLNVPLDTKQIQAIISRISETDAKQVCDMINYFVTQSDQSDHPQGHDIKVMTPLMTFDDRVLDKPLSLAEISRITQDAPSPLNNPHGFINWWRTALMHSSLSGKDVRYILTTLMPNVTVDTLMKECYTLDFDNDGPIEGEIQLENKYPWLKRKHREDHLIELTAFLKKNAGHDRDVSQVLNCKRKPNEPMYEYASRFQKCWKEQAKLEMKTEEDPFFISMFLNGLDPTAAYTLKLSAPDIYSLNPGALLKKIRELDAVGLFTTVKPKIQGSQVLFESDENNTMLFQQIPPRDRDGNTIYGGPGQMGPPTPKIGFGYLPQRAVNASFPPWLNTVVIAAQISDPPFTINDLLTFQKQAPDAEIRLWQKKECHQDVDDLWKFRDNRIVLPKLAYDSLISYVHGVTHVNYKASETDRRRTTLRPTNTSSIGDTDGGQGQRPTTMDPCHQSQGCAPSERSINSSDELIEIRQNCNINKTHDTSVKYNLPQAYLYINLVIACCILACCVTIPYVLIACNTNTDTIVTCENNNTSKDNWKPESDNNTLTRQEELLSNDTYKRMRRAIPARITKPKPYLEVGMLQHVPITDLEMQCLYYPLTPNATQSYYIQNVTYVTLEEYTVDVRVEYQSVTNEVIVTRTIVLSVITERPTVEFCNAVWKDLLPNFFVHLDQDAFVYFQPIVLKATQIKSPQLSDTSNRTLDLALRRKYVYFHTTQLARILRTLLDCKDREVSS